MDGLTHSRRRPVPPSGMGSPARLLPPAHNGRMAAPALPDPGPLPRPRPAGLTQAPAVPPATHLPGPRARGSGSFHPARPSRSAAEPPPPPARDAPERDSGRTLLPSRALPSHFPCPPPFPCPPLALPAPSSFPVPSPRTSRTLLLSRALPSPWPGPEGSGLCLWARGQAARSMAFSREAAFACVCSCWGRPPGDQEQAPGFHACAAQWGLQAASRLNSKKTPQAEGKRSRNQVAKDHRGHGVQPVIQHYLISQTMALSATPSHCLTLPGTLTPPPPWAGQLIPKSNRCFREEPPLVQLEVVSSFPVSFFL